MTHADLSGALFCLLRDCLVTLSTGIEYYWPSEPFNFIEEKQRLVQLLHANSQMARTE
jgi:hypothetical protein